MDDSAAPFRSGSVRLHPRSEVLSASRQGQITRACVQAGTLKEQGREEEKQVREALDRVALISVGRVHQFLHVVGSELSVRTKRHTYRAN